MTAHASPFPRPVGASSMFRQQAPAPAAIVVLNDFASYAASVQRWLDLKNEGEKWCYRAASPQLWKFDTALGITPAWINAFDQDGRLNGQGIYTYFWDFARQCLTTRSHEVVSDPVLTWANGTRPCPELPAISQSGADIVADWLTEAANGSSSLRARGLTVEAIAAARDA